MRERVALVSLYLSPNYGAILQSLALQQYIEQQGFWAHYLPYTIPFHFSPLRYVLNRGNYLFSLILGVWKRNHRTQKFRSKYIHIAPPRAEFELYVAGSDQIWRPQLTMDTHGFFLLSDKKGKLISYGSSFGVASLPYESKEYYKKALSKFSKISVREKSGELILSELGFNGFVRVCDPTFLLSSEDWMHYMAPRQYSSPYILCYVMKGDIPTADYIHHMAQQYNKEHGEKYKIITIGDREYRKFKFGYHLVCDAGPSEFLSYIYYADAVITSSFHGTCFSLIFNKSFRNVLDRKNPYNTRIVNLLQEFDIADRITYTDQPIHNTDMPQFIPPENRGNILRVQSLGRDFLKAALLP